MSEQMNKQSILHFSPQLEKLFPDCLVSKLQIWA